MGTESAGSWGATLVGKLPHNAWWAPGRINLVGEHTDYNRGWVLPAAIDMGVLLVAAPTDRATLTVRSKAFSRPLVVGLEDLHTLAPSGSWQDYFVGVAQRLLAETARPVGLDVLVDSDLPRGSGLSSSAAVTVGFASLLNDEWGCGLRRLELVRVAQSAENDFVGLSCGILDPFAVAMGTSGHVMALDCASGDWDPVPFPDEYRLVAAGTGVSRELARSPYNERCEESAAGLQQLLRTSGKKAANRLVIDDLPCPTKSTGLSKEMRRARHVVTENQRVRDTVTALRGAAMDRVGELLAESHRSLRDDYEVSCPELDEMVRLAERLDGCVGAKMTGAGFGGSVVAVVAAERAEPFVTQLISRYRDAVGLEPIVHICRASEGARRVDHRP